MKNKGTLAKKRVDKNILGQWMNVEMKITWGSILCYCWPSSTSQFYEQSPWTWMLFCANSGPCMSFLLSSGCGVRESILEN